MPHFTAVRIVRCPICGQPVRWEPASRFRPFCSERCRQIDLGAWATDEYRVPCGDQVRDGDAPPSIAAIAGGHHDDGADAV